MTLLEIASFFDWCMCHCDWRNGYKWKFFFKYMDIYTDTRDGEVWQICLRDCIFYDNRTRNKFLNKWIYDETTLWLGGAGIQNYLKDDIKQFKEIVEEVNVQD